VLHHSLLSHQIGKHQSPFPWYPPPPFGYAGTIPIKVNCGSRCTTRWLRRIILAILIAGLAWWAVYELVRPQPRFRFLLPQGSMVAEARWLGSWCAMRLLDRRPTSDLEDRTILFDFNTNRFINPPKQLNKSTIEKLFDTASVRSLDHYIIQHGSLSPSTLQIYHTIAGTFVEHRFPESATLQLSEDNTTLFESTTLPLAPWAALSPAPFSAVPAALLMSCDAQRLCNYQIGFQLVQVRQLPSLTVTALYALPPHIQVYMLNVSGDGKHLLHGSSMLLPHYLQTKDGAETSPDIPGKPQGEFKVDNALSHIWADEGGDVDVYNAHTGKKLYSTTFEKSGKPVLSRCISLQQDWAFVSRFQFSNGKRVGGRIIYEPEQICVLHLPTGRKLDPHSIPQYESNYLSRLVPGTKSGEAIGEAHRVMPSNSSGVEVKDALFRFNADGTVHLINESLDIEYELSSDIDYVTRPPHTNQLVMRKNWKINLPKWVKNHAPLWLLKLLRADRMAIVNAESNLTLWSFDQIDQSSITMEAENVPSIFLSHDQRLLFVPVLLNQHLDQNIAHYRYDVYCLPFSTWLPLWPYLAACLTLILMISQGFLSLRFSFIPKK